MTIEGLKLKLCFHCGSNASAMILQLKDHSGSLRAVLDDDTKKLGYYAPQNGYLLHVIDTDPTSASANGWLEDTSKVAKYMMSDADYSKREGTYRCATSVAMPASTARVTAVPSGCKRALSGAHGLPCTWSAALFCAHRLPCNSLVQQCHGTACNGL